MSSQSPPSQRLTQYEYSADFPPREIGEDPLACSKWYEEVFYAVPAKPPDPTMTAREKYLCSMGARQYVTERQAGRVTCEETARALVKRAHYYRYMNQWTYRSYELFDQAIQTAKELDSKADTDGVDSIAPLYGLMIPMKGTGAVVEYPSGSGCGVLSGYTPVKEAAVTSLIKERHGIIFGTTNVPEFAYGYRTANPASGQTRNPYNSKFTVGGSSGGAASAVAAYNCPIAVSEDTGGSTRVPASCNQNFGFDPPRNHYPNAGNPGLTFVCDQIGLHARSIEDIILVDRALGPADYGKLHDAAAQASRQRTAASIKIGVPLHPFLVQESLQVNQDVRQKLEEAKTALTAAGYLILDREWPSKRFDGLGCDRNVMMQYLHNEVVNGKKLSRGSSQYASSLGQMANFVFEYLDAPVSPKEVIADFGIAGSGHNPGGKFRKSSCNSDETVLRYALGPDIQKGVAIYNSYFEEHGVDLIMFPCANAATPDLHLLAAREVALTPVGAAAGESKGGAEDEVFGVINSPLKHLHIPKMVVPTGLTSDGRPTAVQFWGKAVQYEEMFEDTATEQVVAEFLHLMYRVGSAIQSVPSLRRVDAETGAILSGSDGSS